MTMIIPTLLLAATMSSPAPIGSAPPPGESTPLRIIANDSGQAALAQPKIRYELRHVSGRALPARSDELSDLLGTFQPHAFLDTGSSGFVFSSSTAGRYRLGREKDARFVEIGIDGEHPMAVSIPYTLALTDHPAARKDEPETRRPARRRQTRPPAEHVVESQRLLINSEVSELQSLLGALGGAVDIVGMPALAELLVEIQANHATDDAVPVRILQRRERPEPQFWFTLEMVDHSRRRHPGNQGPLPALGPNPMISNVQVVHGESTTTGDWLLDTGAAVTIISIKAAAALGLVDESGAPVGEPDFTLPMAGVSGNVRSLKGYRITAIELTATDGSTIVFPDPFVVVHDITMTRDDGTETTLDGVLGMNLLLGSGRGFNMLGFDEKVPPTCTSVILDGPRTRMGITLRDWFDQ